MLTTTILMDKFDRAGRNRLERLLSSGNAHGDFPGAAAIIGGRNMSPITTTVGHVSPDETQQMTSETRFDAASLTKPVVTTTLLFQLLERGVLTLEDTISDHLETVADTPRGEVTLRELLTHTSGFQPYMHKSSWTTPAETREDILTEDIMTREPGEKFEYSCLNFVHLHFIIETLTGDSLSNLASKRIFDPVGMTGSSLGPAGLDDGAVAHTYDHDKTDSALHRTTHDPLARSLGGYSGNAGLFTTAEDLAVFAQALLNGGCAPETESRILSPVAVETMRTERARSETVSQAYGWRTGTEETPASTWSREVIGHTGFTGTSLWIDFEREFFAVLLTNAVYHATDMARFRTRFHTVAAAILSELQD